MLKTELNPICLGQCSEIHRKTWSICDGVRPLPVGIKGNNICGVQGFKGWNPLGMRGAGLGSQVTFGTCSHLGWWGRGSPVSLPCSSGDISGPWQNLCLGLFCFWMPELLWFPRRGSSCSSCPSPEFGTAWGLLGLWGMGQER